MALLQFVAIVILALLPILAWSYVLLGKTTENKQLMLKAFIWGGVATVPLLFYRWLWNFFPEFNFTQSIHQATAGKFLTFGSGIAIPLSYILIFMTIGILEEYLKSLAVRNKVPHNEIHYVSDAVEFSIVAALGFAFIENIFYLAEVYYVVGSSALIRMFISRALFATFAHMLFSGIFGYYFGIASFAKRNMIKRKESIDIKLIMFITKKLKFIKSDKLFHFEEVFLGLFYASLLHAIYNIFLELRFTLFLIPFLVFGSIYLVRLLKLKQKSIV